MAPLCYCLWELNAPEQVRKLCDALPSLDRAALLATAQQLRSGTQASANPGQREAMQTKSITGLLDGMLATTQRDPAGSLALPGLPVAQISTWALANDRHMTTNPSDVSDSASGIDLLVQHMLGSNGKPVATCTATCMLVGMEHNVESALCNC